ncbi:MAG: Fic family protein [Mucilaginibacter sp.]|uniref:Fic family protein n=1 Tax=Mucilaginibacter sp. TaxID=1882438 RepID=UPI003264E645
MDLLKLISEYKDLNLSKAIDFDKFNMYAIVHHSTTIEGSTLTEIETQLLLDENLTPKGKPLDHSLMVRDHYTALKFVLDAADKKQPVTPAFIQQINASVMKNTGIIYETVFGQIDSTQGAFRKGSVRAGNSYFPSYDKVPTMVEKLIGQIKGDLNNSNSSLDDLNLSFDVHFGLVSIHPFYDGNGRTSRLLMNYIQQLCNLPLGMVFKEDKQDYFEALIKTRENEDISIFRKFMTDQYVKHLSQEIKRYKDSLNPPKKGKGYSFIF